MCVEEVLEIVKYNTRHVEKLYYKIIKIVRGDWKWRVRR